MSDKHIPEFHGNPNDMDWNPEFVFNLKDKIKDQQATIDKLVEALKESIFYLDCGFHTSKKQLTEYRDLIKSVTEKGMNKPIPLNKTELLDILDRYIKTFENIGEPLSHINIPTVRRIELEKILDSTPQAELDRLQLKHAGQYIKYKGVYLFTNSQPVPGIPAIRD